MGFSRRHRLAREKGTPIHAMCAGRVYKAGPAGNGFRSRHVVLQVNDPTAGPLYLVHVHLHSIADGIVAGALVQQGQVIGTVGKDGAAYPHLHLEFRRGSPAESASVHPLGYLPYQDTANFTEPTADRANDLTGRRADPAAVPRSSVGWREIWCAWRWTCGEAARCLRPGWSTSTTRTPCNEGIGDQLMWVDDVAVEGYQKSNLEQHAAALIFTTAFWSVSYPTIATTLSRG
jgi:hypothetical protein